MTGLTFQPIGHFRTASTRGRGGALLSTFDMDEYRKTPASSSAGRPAPKTSAVAS